MLTVRNAPRLAVADSNAPGHETLKSASGLLLWAVALLCIALLGQSVASGFDIGVLVGGLL